MRILGLDLGTNSIGWALVEKAKNEQIGKVMGLGSRIIPMSQDIIGDFDKGNTISQTAERTRLRSMRRLRERQLLRRERLHRVLNILGFLPDHYRSQIDFNRRLGKFLNQSEPKIAYFEKYDEITKKRKYEFLFKKSFEEMLMEFRQCHPHMFTNKAGMPKLIPYDWTIYYLRKKALTEKIEKEELAWIILNFNQKRGYYQLRGEEDDAAGKNEYVTTLKVVQIEKGDPDKKNNKKTWYNIFLENGWVYSATFTSEPKWLDSEKEFLVTEELDEDGNVKIVKDRKSESPGREKRKITPLPSFDEIDLMTKQEQDKIYRKIKAKTEVTIANSGKTVGTYIFDTLLQKPNQKIRGKLVRTIERKFYKDELNQILQKQKGFHPELQSEELYNNCVRELYTNNDAHQANLSSKDFVHLFLEDIIFYQRPLRSKKSAISNCVLEFRSYKDENGTEHKSHLRAIPKSNPFYQEFRIWQWIYNLSIYRKSDDANVTSEFLSKVEDWEHLFDFLNHRKDIEQKPLLKYFLEQNGSNGRTLTAEIEKYRWNYVEDKKYPCNETLAILTARLSKVKNIHPGFLTKEVEKKLWHLVYSVIDVEEYEKALGSFAKKHQLDIPSFIEAFKKTPPLKSDYGTYSEKAIKKLLTLMRIGKYWHQEAIEKATRGRIEKLMTGEYDETIPDRVRDKAIDLKKIEDFQGLQLWLAQYIVYGRHSEAADLSKWNSVQDLELYLNEFRQHSLRNPIVEQVVTETLRVVKDVWAKYGKSQKDFFSEIHIELGREMKNPAEDRKRITEQVTQNENTNLRIKALLAELQSDGVENVRPYSPMQQEILKIYEDGVLNSDIEVDEDILKISKTAQPSVSDLKRYKLWLEQKYRSPYTGSIIPLNKLFSPEYEIEHIIPQSRYFDDSFSNKVICEAAVNKLKDNQLAYEFIKNHHGEIIQTGNRSVQIFQVEAYETFIKQHYGKNRGKKKKLMLDEIPDKMIERQLNDTRYISKFISSLLSNIVREEFNDDGINSKNVVAGNGKITGELKQDWGLNEVWNELILSRFERLNNLTASNSFTSWNENHQKMLPTVPIELSKGFSKKRIDHRHHAMDALVIACATRDHINLLNNKHAKSNERFDLNRKLRHFEKAVYKHPQTGQKIERDIPTRFKKPWENFTAESRTALESVVISFKQNLRIINKATNRYERWEVKDEKSSKEIHVQKGRNWAIRKSLHKDTVSGKVDLPWVKVPKGKVITATRKSLNTSFSAKTIESITDTGIQKILSNYLKSKGGNSEVAFSPEGIEEMNRDIKLYNDGKPHQPILKVRIYELGSKFPLGQSGNKKFKYVEADKGTNLFFAIYVDENGKRNFETLPLNLVIERLKQGLSAVPEKNEQGHQLLFTLSPNDLVYVPTIEEIEKINLGAPVRTIISSCDSSHLSKRIYKIISFTGSDLHAIHARIASPIVPYERKTKTKGEIGWDNKSSTTMEDAIAIKDYCIKIEVDRLGFLKNRFSILDTPGEAFDNIQTEELTT